jgi:hypothetical protein
MKKEEEAMKRHYYLQGILVILVGLLMLSVATVSIAEEITLTTYYPSPYGVYSEMRLYPKGSPTACGISQEGLMFYSDGTNVSYPRGLYVCGGSPLGWQKVGGGLWELTGSYLYPTQNSWNVGIGTPTPSYKLHVNGDVGWSGILQAGSVPWQRLTSFPSCPSPGQYVRGVGGTLTCASAINSINGMAGPAITIAGAGNITVSNSGNTVTISGGGVGPGGPTGQLYQGANMNLSPNPWNPGSGVDATISAVGGPPGSSYWAASGSDIYNTNGGNIKIHRLSVGDIGYGALPAPAVGTDGTNTGVSYGSGGAFYVQNSGGALGNTYGNDYWVQAANGGAGKWASQLSGGAPTISEEKVCDNPKGGPGIVTCTLSTTDDVCFLTKVGAQDPGKDVNNFNCRIYKSGSTWYLESYGDGNSADCSAICINF